jgi:hypothetical protein
MAGQEFTSRDLRTIYEREVRTTHPDPVDIHIQRSKTVRVHISLEDIDGTSITVTLTAVDPVTGRASATVLASAALAAAGYVTLTIGPGVATVANASLQTVAPRILRTTITGTTTDYDVSVVAELID